MLCDTNNSDIMHQFVNSRTTHSLGWLTVGVIIALNGFLLWQTFTGR